MGLKFAGGQGKNFKDWQEITQSDPTAIPRSVLLFYTFKIIFIQSAHTYGVPSPCRAVLGMRRDL